MISTVAWMLLAIVPQEGSIVAETVDMIEKSHVYNGEGEEMFTQWIFWDWDGSRHRVVAWRMNNDHNFSHGKLTWWDGTSLRSVRSTYWRETWEQFDPELAERQILSECHRRGLRK